MSRDLRGAEPCRWATEGRLRSSGRHHHVPRQDFFEAVDHVFEALGLLSDASQDTSSSAPPIDLSTIIPS